MLKLHGEIIGSSRRINHTFRWHDFGDRHNTRRELQLEHFLRGQHLVDQVLTTILMVSSDREVLLYCSCGICHTAQVELDWAWCMRVGGGAGPALQELQLVLDWVAEHSGVGECAALGACHLREASDVVAVQSPGSGDGEVELGSHWHGSSSVEAEVISLIRLAYHVLSTVNGDCGYCTLVCAHDSRPSLEVSWKRCDQFVDASSRLDSVLVLVCDGGLEARDGHETGWIGDWSDVEYDGGASWQVGGVVEADPKRVVVPLCLEIGWLVRTQRLSGDGSSQVLGARCCCERATAASVGDQAFSCCSESKIVLINLWQRGCDTSMSQKRLNRSDLET